MRARDPRFDGVFFIGVRTTGIYCRPICPARPLRKNVEFFPDKASAERAGYRPCLRCRPESLPHSPAWLGKAAIVRRAVKVLGARKAPLENGERFAARFGVTARHLRRLFVELTGRTPRQLADEQRLSAAYEMTLESKLPLTEVAFASGFRSIRRFNDAFKAKFGVSPSAIRREKEKRVT